LQQFEEAVERVLLTEAYHSHVIIINFYKSTPVHKGGHLSPLGMSLSVITYIAFYNNLFISAALFILRRL
jgi:hypothetical protein